MTLTITLNSKYLGISFTLLPLTGNDKTAAMFILSLEQPKI